MEQAAACHAAALAEIHASAFPPGARWRADALAVQLGQPGVYGWIDPSGGMVLARVAADEAEILTLTVAPGVRRRGVGRRLVEQAMRTAGLRGATTMLLEVAAGNLPAQRLYSAAGFRVVGRRRDYYAAGEDALILRVDGLGRQTGPGRQPLRMSRRAEPPASR